jgi:hypothetical protein
MDPVPDHTEQVHVTAPEIGGAKSSEKIGKPIHLKGKLEPAAVGGSGYLDAGRHQMTNGRQFIPRTLC